MISEIQARADTGKYETVRKVKNLGWVLRHWIDVARITVRENPYKSNFEWCVFFELKDGRRYVTDYASLTVLHGFLDRPVYAGLAVDWFGKVYTIGSAEYREDIPRGTWWER